MFHNENIEPFLVLILRFLTKKRLWFLNCAGSYKKNGRMSREHCGFMRKSAGIFNHSSYIVTDP